MTEIAEKYDKIAGNFAARVQGVADDAWDNAAPCDGWTAKDVVGHVTGNAASVLAGTGFTPTEGLGPKEAWAEAHDAMRGALADPEKANVPYTSPFGPTTVEGFIGQLLISDTLIHTWDLARATGQDETLDAEAVTATAAALAPLDAMIRMPGVFGPKVQSAPDANEQTKLLNFVGRTV